ncbi:MAG TPA: hypothetical protein VII74_04530 [Chthoniobacterales bacterium]
MVKSLLLRAAIPLFVIAFSFALNGCEKKETTTTATPIPSPSPSATVAVFPTPTPAPPLTGSFRPASVLQTEESIAHYLHFPEGESDHDSVAQFYCDISEEGVVEATYGVIGKDTPFRTAVQSALDWGHFAPAMVNGHAVAAYLGGTVVFAHQNGAPVVGVILATYGDERIRKMANFVQPQLIGGLRPEIEKLFRRIPQGIPPGGWARVVVKVDARGEVTGVSGMTEIPKGSGLGNILRDAVAGAQFTPAYDNGKPVPGEIDVVANFAQL